MDNKIKYNYIAYHHEYHYKSNFYDNSKICCIVIFLKLYFIFLKQVIRYFYISETKIEYRILVNINVFFLRFKAILYYNLSHIRFKNMFIF